MLVRSDWLVRVREVLPRYDARTPAQAEVLRHWAGVVASRRAAEAPGEALGPEFFEVACLAAARSAGADDPFEWLDRRGRDAKSPRTAELADRHISPRPGTDAALLLAVVHVLLQHLAIDPRFQYHDRRRF